MCVCVCVCVSLCLNGKTDLRGSSWQNIEIPKVCLVAVRICICLTDFSYEVHLGRVEIQLVACVLEEKKQKKNCPGVSALWWIALIMVHLPTSMSEGFFVEFYFVHKHNNLCV